MRFVPLQRAPEQRQTTMGVPPRWWSILLASPLPELTDAGTTIDGTAYSMLSPASVANVHPGRLGELPTVRPGDLETVRQEKPELELVVGGAAGIVCNASCAVRSLAIHGSAVGLRLAAAARIEHVMVGSAPDAEPTTGGDTGIRVEKETTVARYVLVTAQSGAGVSVESGARLDAERLEVSRCGQPASGGGVVILSDGSSVRSSLIAANLGAGILLGAADGSRPATSNSIDGCTISSNLAGIVIGPGSSRNVITRNDIMWNRLGGVTVAPSTGEARPPRENRISANRFDENGLRPIVLDTGAPDPNSLRRPAPTCEQAGPAPIGGISPPRIERVSVADERVVIRGTACPGEVVELYQSYVTSGVREETAREMPRIRPDESERESMTATRRSLQLPSIGEFNYLGATSTAADGSFEASFPFPALIIAERARAGVDQDTAVWATEVMRSAKPEERAFSAIAIDTAGNTSEMSVRRKVD
jgi:parallel beta-helix repeat protein